MIRKPFTFTIGLIFFGFLFVFLPSHQAVAGECQATINFDAKPNPIPANQDITFKAFVTLSGLGQSGDPNEGYCTKNSSPVKAISVTFYAGALGTFHKEINLAPSNAGPYLLQLDVKPSEHNLRAGQSFSVYATVYPSPGTSSLTSSSTIKVNVTQGFFGSYACVTDNGQGVMVYACGSDRYCSDTVGCTVEQKAVCVQILDNSQCGKPPPSTATHKACNNAQICVPVPGAGADTCTTDLSCATTGGKVATQSYSFNLLNPIGVTDFQDLINIIGKWIFNLAIPIAVIIIIYAGVLMLTAGGVPARFQKGAKALWYAVIGLAVVLIGKGFVTLVQSILSLKNK